MSEIFEFNYTGGPQLLNLSPCIVVLEVYGAQGTVQGGKGGYSKGTYYNEITEDFNVFVGGQNGYNGGGVGSTCGTQFKGGNGGGATDIRIIDNELSSRIIVAGGGGGGHTWEAGSSSSYKYVTGGSGGGLSGGDGAKAKGGTQTTGYALGQGESGAMTGNSNYQTYSVGGGGGYYGGFKGNCLTRSYQPASGFWQNSDSYLSAAGGGSGYLSPLLVDTETTNGLRTGDGYAKITVITYLPYTVDKILDYLKFTTVNEGLNVKNIKISINGNEIENFVPTEDDFNYNIPYDSCIFGRNTIDATITIESEDGDIDYTYTRDYIKYGSYMPANSNITEVIDYMNALKTQIIQLKEKLANILIDNGIVAEDGITLTGLINLVESMTINNESDIMEYNKQINRLENEIRILNSSKNTLIEILNSKGAGIDSNASYDNILSALEGWGNISPQHLYNVGDEYTDVTGGWVECNKYAGNYVTVTSEKRADCLYLYSTVRYTFSGSVGFVMNDTIDFTDFVRISIDKTITMQTAGSVNLQILNESDTVVSTHTLLQNTSNVNGSHNALFELDIRHLTGPHKLKVIINNPGNNGGTATIIIDVKINRITLDRK